MHNNQCSKGRVVLLVLTAKCLHSNLVSDALVFIKPYDVASIFLSNGALSRTDDPLERTYFQFQNMYVLSQCFQGEYRNCDTPKNLTYKKLGVSSLVSFLSIAIAILARSKSTRPLFLGGLMSKWSSCICILLVCSYRIVTRNNKNFMTSHGSCCLEHPLVVKVMLRNKNNKHFQVRQPKNIFKCISIRALVSWEYRNCDTCIVIFISKIYVWFLPLHNVSQLRYYTTKKHQNRSAWRRTSQRMSSGVVHNSAPPFFVLTAGCFYVRQPSRTFVNIDSIQLEAFHVMNVLYYLLTLVFQQLFTGVSQLRYSNVLIRNITRNTSLGR